MPKVMIWVDSNWACFGDRVIVRINQVSNQFDKQLCRLAQLEIINITVKG
jgi:hypothetical protein